MKEIVAQLTFEARASNEINQSSGVSVRVTINNYESVTQQRREARRAPRRARDRAAPQRPARRAAPRPPARSSSSTPARRRSESDADRAPAEPRRAHGVRPALHGRGADAGHRRTSRPAGASRCRDAMPAEEYLEGVQAIPGLREAIARLGAVREPGLHRRRHRVRARGPAPAPEAEQGPRGRAGASLPRLSVGARVGRSDASVAPLHRTGTARSASGSTAEQVFEKLVRVPVVHRRRAAGARLAAAPGRRARRHAGHGARRLPRAAARGAARALPRVQSRARARRDARAARGAARPRARDARRAGAARRASAGASARSSTACRVASPRRSSSCATTSSRTTRPRADFEHLLEELDEHPRASRTSSAATAISSTGRSRSTTTTRSS